MSGTSRRCRIGLDIGGTFTDLVLDDGAGGLHVHKVPTTPDDPARAALTGLTELLEARGLAVADCETLVHGTTLVTNAVIERRGARTALLVTEGFRDVLEMGSEQRYDIYDLFLQYPEPLVPRQRRLEVTERVDRDGRVVTALDEDQVLRHGAWCAEQGVEAVAVCFLHAYRNPAHERRAAELLREAQPGLSVCASSEVAPEIREFERTSTTVCNAYVQPAIDRYVGRLEAALGARGFQGRFFLMQSSGALASPDVARAFPVRLLESGPAGGAVVAGWLARTSGIDDLLAFDMGGTTAKLCCVIGGRPQLANELEAARVHNFKRGSGIPVLAPVVDLMEIGAGGGSLAQRSSLGLLQVGPRSAGADPGPACYGRGGETATVTDACLALGYLDPDHFLGGSMPLDPTAADAALDRTAAALGLDRMAAAWGIHQIACENMASAARVHIIEKGHDPRRLPLVAFGGAGPLHAVRIARTLGSPEVIVPQLPGVASALGFLVAPAGFAFGRSRPGELSALDWNSVRGLYAELEGQAAGVLADAGVAAQEVALERTAGMRLRGQFHDIEVAVPAGDLDETAGEALAGSFAAEYRRLYHAVLPGYEPLIRDWRLRASGPEPSLRVPAPAADGGPSHVRGHRPAWFPEAGGYVETPVVERATLGLRTRLVGPIIVEERECTTVAGPGDLLTVDTVGSLRIQVGMAGVGR